MRWVRKIHKWVSIIIAIQFLLWLLSGLYFNVMDGSKASGRTYKSKQVHQVQYNLNQLLEPQLVLQKHDEVVELNTVELLGQPYYLLAHEKALYAHFVNRYSLVNALTGQLVAMDKTMANALAKQSYNGPGEIIESKLISNKLVDFPKQKNPSWQINFNDEINTSVYIEAGSGRIVGHSDDHKRLADIAFMLHFIDYDNVGGFNNIQNWLFAFFTLWLTLSGLIWTIELGIKGRYTP
ncbi:hypothetical protein A9Q98_04190 [Thalassotalea sp. 42_200_T64]|nr:hypothetical protein A9Q98_04190 [Thalassotalea sp. 42_200_T64]